MTTIVEHVSQIHTTSRPTTPPPHITLNTSVRGTPAAVPNKHIPVCTPGKAPSTVGLTSPQSVPPTPTFTSAFLLLARPDQFPKLSSDPPIYSLESSNVLNALDEYASRPLPDPKRVFPWLHGLHSENALQLAFFVARRKTLRKVPQDLRALTIVKAGGNLLKARLRGAVSPDEILNFNSEEPSFIDCDPKDGFSVRNFHIQTAKMATVSDIIVYGDDDSTTEQILETAQQISQAQLNLKARLELMGWESNNFNTYVVLDSFKAFEQNCPEIVAINAEGEWTGKIIDFFLSERIEMASMTKASEIAPNVFLGPTPDHTLSLGTEQDYDILIEASDMSQFPDSKILDSLKSVLGETFSPTVQFEVPASGNILPPTWTHKEIDALLNTCQWIWEMSGGESSITPESTHSSSLNSNSDIGVANLNFDQDGDLVMSQTRSNKSQNRHCKILIHCTDGYTETTLLAVTYFMYANGISLSEAWIRLHREFRRNFFAYPTDIALLTSIQPRILTESPIFKSGARSCLPLSALTSDPPWLKNLDGSLPSRILHYMYLGNLTHANNPALLKELGIGRIVSVGEKVNWINAISLRSKDNVVINDGIECLVIDNVQDNGMDSLTDQFEKCLDFIERGKQDGIATLVHCRVGVSRSATICIAEVMKELGFSFPRAYCFVRARRLNVIIQPHLRFIYELLKWEEGLRVKNGLPLKRELEWSTISREIAAMNRPYSR